MGSPQPLLASFAPPTVLLLLLLALAASSSAAAAPTQLFFTQGHGRRSSPSAWRPSSTTSSSSSWSALIHHRDSLLGSPTPIRERLALDGSRFAALSQRLMMAAFDESDPSTWKPQQQVEASLAAADGSSGFQGPVISGLSQGSGEYFTRIGLGTPPAQSYFVMDTGSDLSWTQCQPCKKCYKQSDPYFNPAGSSSYKSVECSASLCSELFINGCNNDNKCLYQVNYGDGSFTVGYFALESLTFGGNTVASIAFGCGEDNEGLFQGAGGLLGLGRGRLSFPSQVKLPFSYCLVDRFSAGTASELIFGEGAIPSDSVFTSLLENPKPRLNTFYYVSLEGISVGGKRLSLQPSLFQLQNDGTGGVILDSGTSITRLTQSAYDAMRDAFVSLTPNLPSASSFSLFDTCYNLAGMNSVSVPTIDLHFANDATLQLPAANYLIPVDTSGTFCLAFAGTSAPFSIIGNMQQQSYRVSYDAGAGRVGFSPNRC